MTILRESLNRAVSPYCHQLRGLRRTPPATAAYIGHCADFAIRQDSRDNSPVAPQVLRCLSNRQTPVLSAVSELRGTHHTTLQRVTSPAAMLTDASQRRSPALAWMQQMQRTGLTERYRETSEMIADLHGIPQAGSTRCCNRNDRRSFNRSCRSRLKQATVPLIEVAIQHNFALDRCTAELFTAQYARFRARLQPTACDYRVHPVCRSSRRQARHAAVQARCCDTQTITGTSRISDSIGCCFARRSIGALALTCRRFDPAATAGLPGDAT